MTTEDIVSRLCTRLKAVTQARIQKAQILATQNDLTWADVLKAMSDQQRQQVEQAQ